MKFFEFYDEENDDTHMLNLATIKSYQVIYSEDDGSQSSLDVVTMDGTKYYAIYNIQDCLDELNKGDNDPGLYNRKV